MTITDKDGMRILICDRVGLRTDTDGCHDFSETLDFIEERGGIFHIGPADESEALSPGSLHFFYQPDLSEEEELLRETAEGKYDAVIAAATIIPVDAKFRMGGVRIGAGTGNMRSASWGGSNGEGGVAPLMNTPGFNSRATAHMVFKAILRVSPDLPLDILHQNVIEGKIDTGRDLKTFPTAKLEGKRLLVLGYGNIGREVARLGKTFGMHVVIYARASHQEWIEAQGYECCANLVDAAREADFVSAHVGLGKEDPLSGKFANEGLLDHSFFDNLNSGAMVVNYDRGQILDLKALNAALDAGKVGFLAVDADLFVDQKTGDLSGPLAPFIALAHQFPHKLLLLPHAVADTDHPSRVEGAKQAVSQIFDSIAHRRVINAVGSLPQGYVWGGHKTASGVGYVQPDDLKKILSNNEMMSHLRVLSWQMAEIWQGLTEHNMENDARDLVLAINRYTSLVTKAGLTQPTSIAPFKY